MKRNDSLRQSEGQVLRVVLCLLLLGLAAALPVWGQGIGDLPPNLVERLLALQKAGGAWNEQEMEQAPDVVLSLCWELLKTAMSPEERAALSDVTVSIAGGEGIAPAWVNGRTIFLSEEAVGDLTALGFALGHDVYIDSGEELPFGKPLLTRPFAVRPVLSLIAFLAGGFFGQFPLELVTCPRQIQKCRDIQGIATILGTFGFVTAHEAGHLLLHHGEGDRRSLEQEVKADRKAWEILSRFLPTLVGTSEEEEALPLRLALLGGPFLLLRWQENPKRNAEEIEARREQLQRLAGSDLETQIGLLVDPEPALGRLREVRITWTEAPEILYLNGEPVDPAQVQGSPLKIYSSLQVFAVRQGRFAFEEMTWARRAPASVALTYRAPSPGTPQSEIEDLRRERRWFDLLLATTTPNLEPRSRETARLFYEALDRLKLGRLIDPYSPMLEPRERELAEHWRRRAQALGRWR